ncbi:hypothetical protein [Paenibacillus sp. XY044]|nr:hypothetical protein [Paenibacillus sp. XY044]
MGHFLQACKANVMIKKRDIDSMNKEIKDNTALSAINYGKLDMNAAFHRI